MDEKRLSFTVTAQYLVMHNMMWHTLSLLKTHTCAHLTERRKTLLALTSDNCWSNCLLFMWTSLMCHFQSLMNVRLRGKGKKEPKSQTWWRWIWSIKLLFWTFIRGVMLLHVNASRQVEALVTALQNDVLDNPGLTDDQSRRQPNRGEWISEWMGVWMNILY